jgi:hypothetical protein
MKKWIFWGSAVCVLLIAMAGSAQSADKPMYINLVVDLNVPQGASEDQLNAAKDSIVNIFNTFNEKGINWTLVLTNDASEQTRLLLGQLTSIGNIEIAVSGNHSDELISSKSYTEQVDILERSKLYGESCDVCGLNEVIVTGFMPQSFDQNEDTYKALDSLGFEYNLGFQAGLIYAPGHEADTWPYKVENHKFYAVPVSTYMLSDELIPLQDRYAVDNGISSTEWLDMLKGKLDEISGKDEPLVVSLSSSASGSGEYLDVLAQFIDYAISDNAHFVVTSDLVAMARDNVHELSSSQTSAAKTTSGTGSSVEIESNTTCKECQDLIKATAINASA